MDNKEIGQRIKTIRKLKKITQKELASQIGKKEITIRKYENGDISIPMETLNKIGIALEIDWEYLFSKQDMIKSLVSDDLIFIEKFFNTSSSKIQKTSSELINTVRLLLERIDESNSEEFDSINRITRIYVGIEKMDEFLKKTCSLTPIDHDTKQYNEMIYKYLFIKGQINNELDLLLKSYLKTMENLL